MRTASIRMSLVIDGVDSGVWTSSQPIGVVHSSEGAQADLHGAAALALAGFLRYSVRDQARIDEVLESDRREA